MSSSSTITEAERRSDSLGRRARPGEVLAGLWLDPLGLDAATFGDKIGIPQDDVQALLDGERRMDADAALRVSKALGTEPDFWLRMQAQADLHEREQALRTDLERIERIVAEDAA